MAGVTIQEFGLRFVQECMKNYWGGCLFPAFFLAGILFGIFNRKEKEGRVFVAYTLILFLTVYNPLLVKYVIPKLNFEAVYYRFFWLLPVAAGLAYYCVRLVLAVSNKVLKGILVILMVLVLVCTGTPLKSVMAVENLPENAYKVPDDLIFACEMIHQDSEKENPRVVFDQGMNTLARQYDASLILCLNRDFVLFRNGSTVVGHYTEENDAYRLQKRIMDVVMFQEEVEIPAFKRALNYVKADYLVIPVAFSKHEYLQAAGCEPFAENGNYVIYRYKSET